MSSLVHVLVVDDEPNVGDVLSIYLGRENFRVSIAREGASAPDLIEQSPPI